MENLSKAEIMRLLKQSSGAGLVGGAGRLRSGAHYSRGGGLIGGAKAPKKDTVRIGGVEYPTISQSEQDVAKGIVGSFRTQSKEAKKAAGRMNIDAIADRIAREVGPNAANLYRARVDAITSPHVSAAGQQVAADKKLAREMLIAKGYRHIELRQAMLDYAKEKDELKKQKKSNEEIRQQLRTLINDKPSKRVTRLSKPKPGVQKKIDADAYKVQAKYSSGRALAASQSAAEAAARAQAALDAFGGEYKE